MSALEKTLAALDRDALLRVLETVKPYTGKATRINRMRTEGIRAVALAAYRSHKITDAVIIEAVQ